MRTNGIIYADSKFLEQITRDKAGEQVANVACLPGIVGPSIAMPDIHWGYGFPIGGVAAMSLENGVISPGGVGYDINCGVRLLATQIPVDNIKNKVKSIIDQLFRDIPCGVGSTSFIKLSKEEMKDVCIKGTKWAVERGYGYPEDIEHTEELGQMKEANPDYISSKAFERGHNQLGTLGSGNHFLELQIVEEIYDEEVAKSFGLWKNEVTVMIHSGSRGLGHQTCDDHLQSLEKASRKYNIYLPDRQLASAPINSPEGKAYFSAMASCANFAWANRQIMMHLSRKAIAKILGLTENDIRKMALVYDVAHNIAKIEEHIYDGKKQKLLVHRKGATRAFPSGHPQIPPAYKDTGQPVIIPGDMGRYSYVLVGTDTGLKEAFGTTCHGAGRVLSRNAAIKATRGRRIEKELLDKGIYVRATGRETLNEEVSEAYKDVSEVVRVVAGAGLSRPVAKLRPLGVVKG